jgi:hypothetical protein
MNEGEDNGTTVYRYGFHAAKRIQPGKGEPLFWDIELQDKSVVKVKSGDSLPENASDDVLFIVPGESVCPDKTTWTITDWREIKDMISAHDRLPHQVNTKYHQELKRKIANYDYLRLYLEHEMTGKGDWGKVMRELLTLHVLERKLNGTPIPLIRDPPKAGMGVITPILWIPAKPVFGPAALPRTGPAP